MIGCGIAEHTADCLCDVHIGTPAPIMGPVSDGWMFRQVAERLGLGIPWDTDSVLEVYAKVTELYDLYREKYCYPNVSDISARLSTENPFVYYARIKTTIEQIASSVAGKPDIKHILENVGITPDQFMTALTCSRYKHGNCSMEKLQQMVDDIQTCSIRKICRDYGLNPKGSGRWVCEVFRRYDTNIQQGENNES